MAQITLNSSGVASNGSLLLQSNGTTTAVTIDTAQNMGLGVTPSAWATYKAMEVGGSALSLMGGTSGTIFGSVGVNWYFDGTNRVYKNTAAATYYNQANGQHQWHYAASGTAGNAITFTQAMTLDASGNLGIGTSSPNTALEVNKAVTFTNGDTFGQFVVKAASGATGYLLNFGVDTSAGVSFIQSSNRGTALNDLVLQRYGGNLLVGTTSVSTITGEATAKAQVAGNFVVGNAVAATNLTMTLNGVVSKASRIGFAESGATKWIIGNGAASENGVFQIYDNVNGTGVQLSRGATSWAAISDERLKDIIEPITDAATKVATLRAVIGKYKTDEVGMRRSFLIAQDVQAVLPEAVDSTNTEQLEVRYTEVIPLLVAAIKEQQALITTLTDRITALEQA